MWRSAMSRRGGARRWRDGVMAAGSVVRIVAALLVGAGLALGGWFVERGLRELRAGDRRVSVKGLAEREVRADLAL